MPAVGASAQSSVSLLRLKAQKRLQLRQRMGLLKHKAGDEDLNEVERKMLDHELAIAEEYASVPTTAFRLGRGRFLAALLDAEAIFRTPHFHERYEARARTQLSALLGSPRYRLHRWLRWVPRALRPRA